MDITQWRTLERLSAANRRYRRGKGTRVEADKRDGYRELCCRTSGGLFGGFQVVSQSRDREGAI